MDDDDDYGDDRYMRAWDAKEDDPDKPSEQNWRELLELNDEERIKEMMKRFRYEHRRSDNPQISSLINNVEIENNLMTIVTRIPHLKYKNPGMLVLGYCISANPGKLDMLSQYFAKIDNDDTNKVKANIIRYMRLITETSKDA
jgi:hypothetical protein